MAVGQQGGADQREKPVRRLEAITWNPVEHKLTWTVSQGSMKGKGNFVESEKFSYEIDMDAATMSTSGEGRRFSKSEAASVHALMDLVAKYAAESTVWWDAGEGEPIPKDATPKLDGDRHRHESPTIEPRRPRRRDSQSPKIIQIVNPGSI
jgi:hypothetical protein